MNNILALVLLNSSRTLECIVHWSQIMPRLKCALVDDRFSTPACLLRPSVRAETALHNYLDISAPILWLWRHSPGAGWAGITNNCMAMVRGQVPRRGPQPRRRCIYWLCSSSQACPVWDRRGVRSSHTLPFGLNPGDARERSLIGRGVLTTPPIRPFLVSRG